ncbi:exodeoxyribonuclease VII large subunit, partial [Paenibacillus macerans]
LQHAERLDRLSMRLASRMETRLTLSGASHDRLHQRLLRYHPQEALRFVKRRRQEADRLLRQAMLGALKEKSRLLQAGIRQLDALSPLKVMGRGYSLVYDERGEKLIKTLADVEPGDIVKVKITDGELDCEVRSMMREGAGQDEGTGSA